MEHVTWCYVCIYVWATAFASVVERLLRINIRVIGVYPPVRIVSFTDLHCVEVVVSGVDTRAW